MESFLQTLRELDPNEWKTPKQLDEGRLQRKKLPRLVALIVQEPSRYYLPQLVNNGFAESRERVLTGEEKETFRGNPGSEYKLTAHGIDKVLELGLDANWNRL